MPINQSMGFAPKYITQGSGAYPYATNSGQIGSPSTLGIAPPITPQLGGGMPAPQTPQPVPQLGAVTLPTNYSNPAPINQPGQIVPPTGLIGSEQALRGGFNGALNAMTGGQQNAENILAPTAQQGQDAATAQANLSGANGLQAQQQAYTQMQNNPAQKYQMEQMQRATEQSAAAHGGAVNGNTLRALQENASGIASQNYQNQFNNLGTVADRGTQLQSQIASLRNNLGLNQGQLFTQTGSQLANGRTNAGLAIAQNVSNTANNISGLLNQQGIQVSGNMSSDINTIANLLHSSGMQDKVDNANLASILANISGGQASNLQQGYQQVGNAQAAGIMGTNAAIQNGLQQSVQLGAFSPKTTQSPNTYQSPSTFTAGGTQYPTQLNATLGG